MDTRVENANRVASADIGQNTGAAKETTEVSTLPPPSDHALAPDMLMRALIALSDALEDGRAVGEKLRDARIGAQIEQQRAAVQEMRNQADTILVQGIVGGCIGIAQGAAQGVATYESARALAARAEAEGLRVQMETKSATQPSQASGEATRMTGKTPALQAQASKAELLAKQREVNAEWWRAGSTAAGGVKDLSNGVFSAQAKREEALEREHSNDARVHENEARHADDAAKASAESARKTLEVLGQILETRHQMNAAAIRG